MTLGELFRNKWTRIILIFDVLLVIFIIALPFLHNRPHATLVLDIVPLDSVVTAGGQQFTPGTYDMAEGTYEFTVSHDGLNSKTFTLTLENDHVTTLTTFLSDGSLDFYRQKDHVDYYAQLAAMASASNNRTTDHDTSAEAFIDHYEAANELMGAALPIQHTEYTNTDTGPEVSMDITIRASNDSSCETWHCIEALMLYTDDEAFVNQLLIDKGFNLEDYEIKYKIY